ncbi:MAG: c-type cytochrome [Burkholderiales bacterium]|nr:c-type cytochrome [Burkholderiales bacterium]
MTISASCIACGGSPRSRARSGGLPRRRHHGVGARARAILALACGVAATLAPPALADDDIARAERLFAEHCATCHGVDRGGYVAPALNRDDTRLTAAQVGARILAGSATTLMPPHPTWDRTLSGRDRDRIAKLVTTQPKSSPSWTIDDIRGSLAVLVGDESKLPARPTYPIADLADLMTVMVRGRHAAGDAARVVFVDGRTHRTVGEVRTGWAPHLMDYHPRDPRWAYVRDDMGWVHKIDLFSLQTVRKVRAGLNGASLAVSRDGRFVAAGSYVPHTLVILDATTLEPLKLLPLRSMGPDGKPVESDAGMLLGTPFADLFVVALEQAGQVWIVDLAKPDFPVSVIADVGRHLHDGFLSPDGRHVVVASYDDDVVSIIDLAEKRLLRRIPAGCQPHLGSGAVVRSHGRMLGIATNIGTRACTPHEVTVFDMKSFEVVKRIPVIGPTESPAAHPDAPYIVVDIVGTGPDADKIQFIDKNTLEVVRTVTVPGSFAHSHFPEYTARGDFVYVSARSGGDRSLGRDSGRVAVYDARTLELVREIALEVPAGVFSHLRSRAVVVGLEPQPAKR